MRETGPTAVPSCQQRAVQGPLTPLEQDLAALLADMLVADVQAEWLEREGKETITHARR